MKKAGCDPVKAGDPRLYSFEEQCEQVPGAIAVRLPADGFGQDSYVTYEELDSRANQAAHFLQAHGVGPEVLVGLFMERSLELVLGVLGVLKAGGAFVPLDPANPQERLAFMLKDTRAPVILAQERLLPRLAGCHANVICLDADWERIARQDTTRPLSRVTAHNLASVLYTSGSTGRPKAVLRLHGHFPAQLSTGQTAHFFTPQDRHLLKSSLGVVAFNNELFRPLESGGQMLIVPPGRELDLAYLVRLIAEYRITVIDLVPSMLRLLLDEPALQTCHSLRCITCSGEALPLYLQERLFSRMDVTLRSYYGTTESPGATFWQRSRGSAGPAGSIGCPVTGRQVYILDDRLQPVPAGAPGELYLGGLLARGYLNHPDLTAERFVPNPFSGAPGERMYKTGDLGRYLEDGSLEYLGRADDQVQIRGFRVEPAEIEVTLAQHPGVKMAVVLAKETGHEPGHKQLVAYVVPKDQGPTTKDEGRMTDDPAYRTSPPSSLVVGPSSLTVGELRAYLRQRLPEYMIPSAILVLDALPLLPNGKLDRQALPAPNRAHFQLESMLVPPRNPVEEGLVAMWTELLGLQQVGIHDNFFELGGHSLLAVKLISHVREAWAVDLPLASLFEKQTIAELAALVQNGGSNSHAGDGQQEKMRLGDALRLLEEF